MQNHPQPQKLYPKCMYQMLTWDARVMAWNDTKTSNCSSGSSKNPESILISASLFVTETHKVHPLSSYYRRERSLATEKIGTYVHTSAIWQETVKYVKITPPTWITPAKYSFIIRSKNFPLQTSYVKKWSTSISLFLLASGRKNSAQQ